MPVVHRYPLEWYIDKIERQETFSLPLYGDGELLMAMGGMQGKVMAFGEVVTGRLCIEMREALTLESPTLLRGTDPNLINYENASETRNLGSKFRQYLATLGLSNVEWVDGVFWDVAVREGKLGPFFKAINKGNILLVGNRKLARLPFLKNVTFIPIPDRNAYADIDNIENGVMHYGKPGVYMFCMGLGAAPLIKRVHGKIPGATLLDIGSTLDVFVGLGAQRGWRGELYADPVRLRETIAKNLEGV